MLRFARILLLFLFMSVDVQSSSVIDTISLQQKLRLNVFLDCSSCDPDYIRNYFDLVNYVRCPSDADVHVLITHLPSGNGGYRYSILLKGQNRFKSMKDTVEFFLPPELTVEEERYAILNKIKLSLVYFLMKTPLGDRIQLVVSENKEMRIQEVPVDPWRDWVFDLSFNGSFSGNNSNLSYSLMNNLYISKITSKIKFESSNTAHYEEMRLKLFDGDSLIFSSRFTSRNFSSNNLFARGLGEHGGIGGMFFVLNSAYKNIDLQVRVGPVVEGNLYKYAQASNKQLRLIFSLFYEYSNYTNRTINNCMSDGHFRNELNLIFRKIGTWGYVDLSLNVKAKLNDISQCSAIANTFANINLYKNIFLDMGMSLGLHRDQISLSQEALSVDQILTGQRELESSYSYHFNVGLSYRFGSKYNNHVNPRFNH